jgi:hypothetical protein
MDPDDKNKPVEPEVDPVEEEDTDDLPVADLPPALVDALKDAGVRGRKDWGKL